MKRNLRKQISFVLSVALLSTVVIPVHGANADTTDYDSHWAKESIKASISSGITKGYTDGTFKPDGMITRAEFATIVNRAFGYTAKSEIIFKDVPTEAWYAPEIAKAKSAGYLSGYENGEMKPGNLITRQEVASIVSKVKILSADVDAAGRFSDANTFPSWSRGEIGAVVKSGIMNGYPEGDFRHLKSITRAEAIVTIMKSMGKEIKESEVPLGLPQVTDPSREARDHSPAGSPQPAQNPSPGTGNSVPKAPVVSVKDVNGTYVFSWNPVEGAKAYVISRKFNSGSFGAISDKLATTAYDENDIQFEGIYTYKVNATNDFGTGPDSVNIVVVKNQSGVSVSIGDADGDGLDDATEKGVTKTNPQDSDSDKDGLIDGYEYNVLKTDPAKADTDGNGTLDGQEDFDGDGLTNSKEYDFGSSPFLKDTDSDGLTDYEETTTYKTNPLLWDTDGDTLSDSDEIMFKFDPLKKDSDGNGILDCDEKTQQDVSEENIAKELLSNNDAVPSLSVLATGNVNNLAVIREYTGPDFGDSRSVVGKVIEIAEMKFEKGRVVFKLNSLISPVGKVDGKELNKFLICRYDENGDTEYLTTQYDAVTHSISAEVTAAGTYFVLDIERMFEELGVSISFGPGAISTEASKTSDVGMLSEEESTPPTLTPDQLKSMQNQTAEPAMLSQDDSMIGMVAETEAVNQRGLNTESKTEEIVVSDVESAAVAQADIVFIVDTTGSMGDEIGNVKNNIVAFVDALKAKGIAPNFALIDYQDITYDGPNSTVVHKNGSGNWFYNSEAYKAAISGLKLGDGGDAPECGVDALEMARNLDLRPMAGKFFVLVTDATYKSDNRYGVPSMNSEIELLLKSNINASVVAPTYLEPTYRTLYTKTGGIFVDIYGNFKSELMAIADKIGDDVVGNGAWICLDGPVPVPVKLKELPKEGSAMDTDSDGIEDINELSELTPSKEVDLDKIMAKVSGGSSTDTKYGVVKVYKYNSNPVLVDTDKDGYPDIEDLAPKNVFVTPVVLLHGRTDNSAACFGIQTSLYYAEKGKNLNGNYNSSISEAYKDFFGNTLRPEMSYTSYETQFITSVVKGSGSSTLPQNLGYELKQKGYSENRNMFVFNYPNEDMTKANALKLESYLKILSARLKSGASAKYFFPTKKALADNKLSIDLIGHSNGGLVSRYYIENLEHADNVRRLITIDTPHWGSGLADVNDNLNWPITVPMDADLNPNGAIFGGEYVEYVALNPFVSDRNKYMSANQTDALEYYNHGSTSYNFLDGYDIAAMSEVPIKYLDKNIAFDLKLDEVSTFGGYKTSIHDSFVKNSKYPELATNGYFENALDLKLSDGDNIVNNQSQLGLKFSDDKKTSKLIKSIQMDRAWMNIDTYIGHNLQNHFHGQNQHRKETIQKVINWLN